MLKKDENGKKEAAEKALAHFEKAYALSSERDQNRLLHNLAKTAIEAKRWTKAQHYAEQMLLESNRNSANENNIHTSNIVLGRVALQRGEIEKAKAYLLKAGDIPESSRLYSSGPSMSLANELLDKGEQEVVLAYFELCAKFWKTGRNKLSSWSRSVTNGVKPNFGPYLMQ